MKHKLILFAAIMLSATLLLAGCKSKNKEQKPQAAPQQVGMPGGMEPDVQAPPVDVTQGEVTQILKEVNSDNDKGATNISSNIKLLHSEYNLETNTVIRILQFTTPTDDSRAARLETKHKFLDMLRNSSADLDRLQRGVTYRYEFRAPDGTGLYTFNITKNDLSGAN